MPESPVITDSGNLFDYFHDRVEQRAQSHAVPLSRDTRLYLASLLTERARADREAPPEQTLAELHARAAHSRPAVQARTYRELGDRALYALGCFQGSLTHKLVGPRYYREMGIAAYERVDAVLERWFSRAFGSVFSELSGHFGACVDVLSSVRPTSSDPLSELFEAWLATGDSRVAERLRERGVVLPPRPLQA